MLLKVFPDRVSVARARVDSHDLFGDAGPTIAAIVESCERG